jgi:hypothetical protein
MFKIKSAIVLFLLLVFSYSCINDIDINQVDDVSFVTPILTSFITLDLTQFNFLDVNDLEINFISDESDIHITEFLSHASDGEVIITSYFTNTIVREFIVKYEFYNSLDELIVTTDEILIQPNVSNIQFQSRFNYNQLENATKVRVTITMLNGLPLRPLLDRNFSMNSTIGINYEYY